MKEARYRYIFIQISQNYHVFYLFWQNFAIKSEQKSTLSVKKGDLEPQYFTLRTMKKLGDLSVQNVLNIWANLRLGVLINFVLTTKKRVYQGYKSAIIFFTRVEKQGFLWGQILNFPNFYLSFLSFHFYTHIWM